MLKKGSVLLMLLVAALSPARGQTVFSRVKTDSLKVGDVITYSLLVQRDRPFDAVILPDSAEFAPDFEIRSRRTVKATEYADSVVYELQFFGTGDGFVPNVPVGFVENGDTSYVLAEKAPFYFKSLIAGEQEPEFKPLKPIFAFALSWWPFLLGAAIVALLGYFGYRWYQKRKAAAAAIPDPAPSFIRFDDPIENLAVALEKLKTGAELSEGRYKEFYTLLGDAFRFYFERVYRFPAMEQTTGEVIRDLKRHATDVRLIELSNKVLRAADMVKFAKFEPSLEGAHQHLGLAGDLLKVIREVDGPSVMRMKREFESAQLPKEGA